MVIVLLGAAGSGKGTMCELMSDNLKIPSISIGDLFRDNIKKQTPIGKEAERYVNNGILVPDDVVVKMLKARIDEPDCVNGYILDGYPRSLAQAKILQTIVKVDYVINLNTSKEVLLHRIMGRRICGNCKFLSHTDRLNGVTCPKCGGTMEQRKDDADKSAVERRLGMYEENIKPLLAFYKEQGLLHEVSANTGKEETYAQISKVIK